VTYVLLRFIPLCLLRLDTNAVYCQTQHFNVTQQRATCFGSSERHRAPLLQQFQQHKQIQINHQPHATIFQFIILTFIYSSICFGRFPAHHQELNDCSGSLWFYLRVAVTAVLCSWSGRPAVPNWNVDLHLL